MCESILNWDCCRGGTARANVPGATAARGITWWPEDERGRAGPWLQRCPGPSRDTLPWGKRVTLSYCSSPQGIRINSLLIALCTSPGLQQAYLEPLGLVINGESSGTVLVSVRRAMSERLRPRVLMTQRRTFLLDHSGSFIGTGL